MSQSKNGSNKEAMKKLLKEQMKRTLATGHFWDIILIEELKALICI